MKLKFSLYIFILVLTISCQPDAFQEADDSGLFIKLFGKANDEFGFGVVEATDNGFYLVGTTNSGTGADTDVFLARTDANGNRIWESSIQQDLNQGGNDILALGNGESLVLGFTTDADTNDEKFYLSRINEGGEELESFTYGTDTLNERGQFIRASSSGGYLLVGSTISSDETIKDAYVVKVTSAGDTLFTRTYGLRDKLDEISAIEETEDGNLIWCGTVEKDNGKNMRVVSTDSLGSIIFDFTYEDEIGVSLQSTGFDMKTAPGGYIITGKTFTNADETGSNVLLIKIDKNGQFLWGSDFSNTDTGAETKLGNAVVPTFDGGYAVAGAVITGGNSDIYLLKTNGFGELQWTRTFGGDKADEGNVIRETLDNGLVVLGSIEVENNSVIGLIKTDRDGVTLGRVED